MTSPNGSVAAQVWLGGDRFELRDFPAPALQPGEALAAVDLTTICASDIHTVQGDGRAPCPSILGHETVGRIVDLSGQVKDVLGKPLQVGDRVVWSVTASCGNCARCRIGHTASCLNLLATGHEPLDGEWPLSGGYASHVHLRKGLAVAPVPSRVSDASAAMSTCAMATAMACVDAAGDLEGRRVLVAGAGMLGMCVAAVARTKAATCVEVADPSAQRRELAWLFGATGSHDPSAPPQRRYDVVVELSGASDSVRRGLGTLDIGGALILAGTEFPGQALELDPERVVRSWQRIIGVHHYEPRHLSQAVEFLTQTDLPWYVAIAEPRGLAELPRLLEPSEYLRRSVSPVV